MAKESRAIASERSQILQKVLEYFNSDDWEQYDGFIVFGKEAFDRLATTPQENETQCGRSGPSGPWTSKNAVVISRQPS